jgi:hypothetical protein
MKRATEILVAATLTVVGMLGAAIAVADLVGLDIQFFTSKAPDSVALLVLSLISTSIGLERAAVGQRQAAILENLESFLTRSARVRRLQGTSDIYSDSARLVRAAERRIRSVIVGDALKAPIEFANAAATRLQDQLSRGTSIGFDIVVVVEQENARPDLVDAIKARHALYSGKGIGHLVRVFVLDVPPQVVLDCFIVDRRHATIGLAPTAGSDAIMTAVVFENEPEIADQLAEWFDQRILPAANRVV